MPASICERRLEKKDSTCKDSTARSWAIAEACATWFPVSALVTVLSERHSALDNQLKAVQYWGKYPGRSLAVSAYILSSGSHL